MKKKQYINPEMEIVKIQTLSLMVGSPDAKINDDDTVDAEEVEASEFIRVGTLPEPMRADALQAHLEARLGDRVRLMGNPDRLIRRVGLCTGAGSEFWPDALAMGAEAFLSGEIKHHHALAASASGLTMFECGHHATEEPGIFALADALQKQLDALQWKGCVIKASAGAYPWKA